MTTAAGGAIYVQCQQFSEVCNTLLLSDLGLPNISAGTFRKAEPRKINLVSNRAWGYGNDFATDPAALRQVIDHSTITDGIFVPGQDSFRQAVAIIDGLGQPVVGQYYTCMLLLCLPTDPYCADAAALREAIYYTADSAGICRITAPEMVCPVGATEVIAQISIVGESVAPAVQTILCGSCGPGTARTESDDGKSWWCTPCGPTQYIIDSNNPTFHCQVNPYNTSLLLVSS